MNDNFIIKSCPAGRDGEINRPSRPFSDLDDCIFHFYLSMDNLNSSRGALFAIKNVVPTRIKYILYAHITWFVFENDQNLSKQQTK